MTYVYADECTEQSILDGIRRGRVFLSAGPIVSFRARGSDGVEIVLPGEELPADGTLSLTADVEQLDVPATLWYVTSGSMVALGESGPARTRLAHDRLAAKTWWRLELRNGPATTGDLLALTNPVYVTSGQ
jgi:hypothetical protein